MIEIHDFNKVITKTRGMKSSTCLIYQPPKFNNLPSVIEIDEDTAPYTVLFTINVTDPTNDDICCTLERVSPQTENFIITVTNTSFRVAAGEKAYFSYKSINSYIVRLCCEDDEYRTSGFLQVKIKKPEKFETIELPGIILVSSDYDFSSGIVETKRKMSGLVL